MWDLHGPEIEPVSPALQGRTLNHWTTGKPCLLVSVFRVKEERSDCHFEGSKEDVEKEGRGTGQGARLGSIHPRSNKLEVSWMFSTAGAEGRRGLVSAGVSLGCDARSWKPGAGKGRTM